MDYHSIITKYDLGPHPEGGYFKESYRSSNTIAKSALPQGFTGSRSYSTGIYFLLPKGEKSNLHRIKSDEMWHFYSGGPLTIVQITPEGELSQTTISQEYPQHVVPAGDYFGAYPVEGTEYSFVGCTVSPGFDFDDFELCSQYDLLEKFSKHEKIITKLT